MTKQQFLDLIEPRKKSIGLVLLLVLVNVAISWYVHAVQQPRLDRLLDEWEAKRTLNAGGKNDVAAIYRRGTADLQTFRERIPAKKDFSRVMMETFEDAADNGLKITGVTYKPQLIPEERLVAYAVNMNLVGKYAAIKSFMADLQCRKSLLVINSVSLSNSSMTEESVILNLQLSAYLRSEEK